MCKLVFLPRSGVDLILTAGFEVSRGWILYRMGKGGIDGTGAGAGRSRRLFFSETSNGSEEWPANNSLVSSSQY